MNIENRHYFSLSQKIEIALATFGINLFSLALPLVLMQVYDRIIVNRAIGTLNWLWAGLLVFLIGEMLLRISRNVIQARAGAFIEYSLSCAVIQKVLSSKAALPEYARDRELIDTVNKLSSLRAFYTGESFQSLIDFPFVVVFLLCIYYLSPLVGLVVSIIFIFHLLLLFYTSPRLFESSERVERGEKLRHDYIIETLSHIANIKSLSNEEKFLRRHDHLLSHITVNKHKETNLKIIPQLQLNATTLLAHFSTILIGTYLIIEGRATLGVVTACTLIAGRCVQPFQGIVTTVLRIKEIKKIESGLSQLFNLPSANNDTEGKIFKIESGNIIFNDVLFTDGSTIKNELLLPSCSFFVLDDRYSFSHNFVSCIRTLSSPVSGSIYIDGNDLKFYDPSLLRGNVEYLGKKEVLFKGSILDNITLYHPHKAALALDTACLLLLDSFVANLPQGYETVVDDSANSYIPRGVIQRIALARVLITRPKVLIVDRFEESLDSESFDVFKNLLNKLQGMCTIIYCGRNHDLRAMATHRFDHHHDKTIDLIKAKNDV